MVARERCANKHVYKRFDKPFSLKKKQVADCSNAS
jgi:hypothetical protein